MAAPDELFCWEGDWGLPSVSTDCLVVLVSIRPHRFDSVRSGSFVPLLHGHISAETPRRSSVLRLINKRETAARSQPAIVFSYCCFRETDAWRDVTTWQATCNTEFSTFWWITWSPVWTTRVICWQTAEAKNDRKLWSWEDSGSRAQMLHQRRNIWRFRSPPFLLEAGGGFSRGRSSLQLHSVISTGFPV